MTRIRVGALEHRLAEVLCPIARPSPMPEEDGITVLPATRRFAAIRDRKIAKVRGRVDSLALLRAERGAR